MKGELPNYCSTQDLTNSNIQLTNNIKKDFILKETAKRFIRKIQDFVKETTVEPCLFVYMMCISISSLAVQNMHLEKSCRVTLNYTDDICDRIMARDTANLTEQMNNVQAIVAKVVAWKFPLQTGIPAVLVLFLGAWSDKTKKRKIFILFPMIGELITNTGLLFATFYFKEISLIATALIEALPPALTGSYIIIFMGMFSFMADRTAEEDRTFRFGLVTICVTLGTPTGTALSGIILKSFGYYGTFGLLFGLHFSSFIYGMIKLEDSVNISEFEGETYNNAKNAFIAKINGLVRLVLNTAQVVFGPRTTNGRLQIFLILLLYLIMVGPLYGDSQVSYLYAIRKFQFTEVDTSIYWTINTLIGLVGTFFCVSILSKKFNVGDSIIGIIASVSRIAACFVFAFAPNRKWFYTAPVFNIFSHTGLTAIRSIASKSVRSEEVAKLNSIIGVSEALAPSIYMPTSSYIYIMTMEYFPGAFYMFDAALTLVAVVLFGFVYRLTRLRLKTVANESSVKKEISRF